MAEYSNLACHGVAQGAKRDEQAAVLIKCHVAVHHGAEADRADCGERHAVFLRNLFAEIAVTFLQAFPNNIQAVRPDAVFVLVLPLETALGDRRMILTDQHSLDTRRAEFNAK